MKVFEVLIIRSKLLSPFPKRKRANLPPGRRFPSHDASPRARGAFRASAALREVQPERRTARGAAGLAALGRADEPFGRACGDLVRGSTSRE